MTFFSRNKKYKIYDYNSKIIGKLKLKRISSVHLKYSQGLNKESKYPILYVMKFDGTMDIYKHINPFEALIIEHKLNKH